MSPSVAGGKRGAVPRPLGMVLPMIDQGEPPGVTEGVVGLLRVLQHSVRTGRTASVRG